MPSGTPGGPIVPRVLVFHTSVTTGDAKPHDGLEFHFFIRLDGTTLQYVDTSRRADAQWDANPFAISCETADNGDPEHTPWSGAQLMAMEALARWCDSAHGIPLHQTPTWDGAGLGYHSMFAEWNHSNHSCPGSLRKTQWPVFLVRFTVPPIPPTPLEDDMPLILDLPEPGGGGITAGAFLLDGGTPTRIAGPTDLNNFAAVCKRVVVSHEQLALLGVTA